MRLIIGIDEVGRGAWAGPLAVGVVALADDFHDRYPELTNTRHDESNVCHPELVSGSTISSSSGLSRGSSNDTRLDGNDNELRLNDSKKLAAKQREKLAREIKKSAVAIGIGWVDAPTIDKIGLTASLKLATKRAYHQVLLQIISDNISEIIIDGTINFLDDPRAITLIKADSKVAAVSAASIIAKVARDHYMTQLDRVFPEYSFAKHVGYGTKLHSESLENFGAIAGIHRQSFAPIKKYNVIASKAKQSNDQADRLPRRYTPRNDDAQSKRGFIGHSSGHLAENVATEFLKQQGHQIIAQNWKTKYCEIDIISVKNCHSKSIPCHPELDSGSNENNLEIPKQVSASPPSALDSLRINSHESICLRRNDSAGVLYFTEVKYRENSNFGNGLSAITPKKLNQMRFAAKLFLSKYTEFTKNYDIKIAAISLSKNPPQVDEFIENIT
ncbi:MAG: YraN family protein [Candidatus Nomurabacteria bacterium]|jgi:ribonuclease HII/Holliday junction resolvase-like predicted endonuclease|nr:YraN family protein [Candidatus Nomurabacteria bacterium]